MSYLIEERKVTVYDVVKDGVIRSTCQTIGEAMDEVKWFEDRDRYAASDKRTVMGDAYWGIPKQ